jgi:thymidylate kinase
LTEPTVVIALSGLDGAGKSSQAARLAARLRESGHPVDVHWMALGHSSLQRRLKGVMRSVRRRTDRAGSDASGEAILSVNGVSKSRTRHHPAVTHVWVSLLAIIYGLHFRRVAMSARHRVVVFDRYALDAIAQSRYFYAPQANFRVARFLFRTIAPTPHRSYLLAVAGEVALARKPEQYDVRQLDMQARLLAEEADRMHVTVVDGTRPADDLSDMLVSETLSAISASS